MKQMNNFKNKVMWEQYYDPSFNWNNLDFYRDNQLSEDFIREFKDDVYWLMISCYQTLSEEFIREFKDRVRWTYIFKYQKLSKNFIREFKDKLDWNLISEYKEYQNWPEAFIKELQNKSK